jgi:type 1 glutamine amidotransferase
VALLAAVACGSPPMEPIEVLAFTRTTGFRHASIEPSVTALEDAAAARGWRFERTEDPALFTDAELERFDVVVFLLTSGDILDDAQQAAFERWLRSGRGFVGVHSASDTEHDWPWYGQLVGAYFLQHPIVQRATVHVAERDHPSTAHLTDPWEREDEWYDFATNPRATVDVLLTVDESTYTGGTMGSDHPIAWSHAFDGGRAFYTALGHTDASWSEQAFVEHVARGIEWAAQP